MANSATSIATTAVQIDPNHSSNGCHHRADKHQANTAVFSAFLCGYQALSGNYLLRDTEECLCIRRTPCFECCDGVAGGKAQSRGLGILTQQRNDEYCRIACHCCDFAQLTQEYAVQERAMFAASGLHSHFRPTPNILMKLCVHNVVSLVIPTVKSLPAHPSVPPWTTCPSKAPLLPLVI